MSASPELFTLFHKFPPELKLDILGFCSRNDLVCLSLTGSEMRNLVAPLIPNKPNLTWVDQLGSTADVPSECPDVLRNNTLNKRGCVDARDRTVVYSPIRHRYGRHEYTGCRVCSGCRTYPSNHPVCSVSYCKKHCACISCPLFMRLRGWMGDRKYCAECNQFTTRTKRNNGRCTHGRKKVRKTPNNHWSRSKGLSYGNRWWRKWGTHGIDHEAYQPNDTGRRNARVV
ncbi:f-box domain protein [Fusarium sp. NRRL 52700]|nr:f-box domain protein [Fusarium sp. NRRL 52700]